MKKVDPSTMREVNRAMILDVLRADGELSRSEVARRTALAKPTVSAIVEQLIDGGVVIEVGLGAAMTSGGRRPRLIRYNPCSETYLGVQIGVNKTRVAVADGRGDVLVRNEGRTVKGDPARTVADIARLVPKRSARSGPPRAPIKAATVTVPGLVARETGRCIVAPNLDWHDVPLRDALTDALGVAVSVENTTRAASVAESRIGVAREIRSFVWIYAGTGIGSSLVIDGRLLYGHDGFSGEIGHCPVLDDGPLCGCGRVGCLETVASAAAIARQANAAIASGERTLLAGGSAPIDAADVATAASEGDPLSRRLLANAGDYLGRGVSYLLNVLNPEMVVIGGPLAGAGELLLGPVRASVERHALEQVDVRVVSSALDGDAEVRGAVFLAMGTSPSSIRADVTA